MKDKSLLILDDDSILLKRLSRSMEQAGFDVTAVETVEAAAAEIEIKAPAYALLDMKLEDGSGLDIVTKLRHMRPDSRIVMLTGFGNIATAVAAVKAGATDYLPKPADVQQITAALLQEEGTMPAPPEDPMSADRVRWEHIQRVYEQCNRNVSETARRLKMHRRTLQRILAKHAPHN